MKTREVTMICVVILLALASPALAQVSQDPGSPTSPAPAVQVPPAKSLSSDAVSMTPPREEGGIEVLRKKLGITEDQKKAMRQLYAGYRDRTRKARMSLASLRDEKQTMLLSSNVDQKRLAQIDDQVVKLVSEVLGERLKMQRDRLAVLTPNQVDRLADLMAKKALRSEQQQMHHRAGHADF